MAKRARTILADITAAELKRMLAVKEKVEKLEGRRRSLATELAKVEKEIDHLLASGVPGTRRKKAAKKKVAKKKVRGKKIVRKKVAAKKAGRKVVKKAAKKAAKKATRKTTAKKTAQKKTVRKKTAKKTARKAPAKRAAAGATLEDVVIAVIKAAGKEMSFPDIRDTITSQKLYKSKSKNFDNVLRRTISTAKGIKRVGRGIYAVK
jgi:hypothetical protein